jgi:leucyl-tRNA synthetase
VVPEEATRLHHKTIKKIRDDIALYKFNTAISALMVYVNYSEKNGLTQEDYEEFIRLLAPFAPHLTEELWTHCGHTTSIHTEKWPVYSDALVREERATIGVQINGKMRGTITLSPDAHEEEALSIAKSTVGLSNRLTGTISKVVYIPGKVLSLIIQEE